MTIILKLTDLQKNNYKLIKLSELCGSGCRVSDLIDNHICYDESVLKNLRRKFYRTIIDSMIKRGFIIEKWGENEVTNSLHDRIFRYYRDNNINIDLVEIENKQFGFIDNI